MSLRRISSSTSFRGILVVVVVGPMEDASVVDPPRLTVRLLYVLYAANGL